mgnify:CR=1 FL=1
MQTSQSINDQTAHISLQISRNVKKQGKQNNLNRAISFVAPSSHHTSQLYSLVSEAGTLPSDTPQNRQDPVSNFFCRAPPGPVRSGVAAVSVRRYLGPTTKTRKSEKTEKVKILATYCNCYVYFSARKLVPALWQAGTRNQPRPGTP